MDKVARSFDSGSAWALGGKEVFRSPSLRMTELGESISVTVAAR
jgi:hypothetical protein